MRDKIAGRFDFKGWAKRISTWLGILSTSCQAAGVFFIAAPPEWKDGFPAVFGFVLLGGGMVASALVPFATSFLQNPKP